jgi:hypothetical protein
MIEKATIRLSIGARLKDGSEKKKRPSSGGILYGYNDILFEPSIKSLKTDNKGHELFKNGFNNKS